MNRFDAPFASEVDDHLNRRVVGRSARHPGGFRRQGADPGGDLPGPSVPGRL